MNVHFRLEKIIEHDIPLKLTKAEAVALAKIIRPDLYRGVVVGSLATAGVMDKIGKAFKKVLKTSLKVLLPLLILAPMANGMSIDQPGKYADVMEKAAIEHMDLDIDIDVKEKKSGDTQHLTFSVTGPDGSTGTLTFMGDMTDSGGPEGMDVKVSNGATDDFKTFMQEWGGSLSEIMQKKFMEAK